jgi:hypothetical protein
MTGLMIPDYHTTAEAAAVLGLSNAGFRKAAKAEGWRFYQVGNVHMYATSDIREYRDHRQRTKLVKSLGWCGRGLYRNDDIDIECPVCGAFAVEWPAAPEIPIKFMCLEGHEGEI